MKNKRLHELIFFVTSRCNSRCRHCFNWRNIGKVVDLDLIEIEKRAKRLPHFDNLLLSGGEPFLRKDLADLINIFVRNNKIKTVSIPTNGLLTASIIDILEKILLIPNINAVNINFSLDGLNDIHDNIRGIEGNFVITMESIKAVSALREKYPRLNILINTVISGENINSILPLLEYLSQTNIRIDGHYFEIIRPFGPDSLGNLQFDFSFYRQILAKQYKIFKENIKKFFFIKMAISKILFLGRLSMVYRLQYNNYFFKKEWPVRCSAGKNIIVMNDRGEISVCELRDKKFDLLEYEDFNSLITSKKYQEELAKIVSDKCFCTHSCFLNASIHNSVRMKFLAVAWHGFINFIYYEIISNNS